MKYSHLGKFFGPKKDRCTVTSGQVHTGYDIFTGSQDTILVYIQVFTDHSRSSLRLLAYW